jgi:hypothetical protein
LKLSQPGRTPKNITIVQKATTPSVLPALVSSQGFFIAPYLIDLLGRVRYNQRIALVIKPLYTSQNLAFSSPCIAGAFKRKYITTLDESPPFWYYRVRVAVSQEERPNIQKY